MTAQREFDDVPASSVGPLAAALAKAQMKFGTVTRDKRVTVQTKAGGSYTFTYAPLDTILAAVRGPLSENGLALVQMLNDGALETTLIHESGGSLTGRIALPATTDIQALGSAITYLRRYAIQAVLGIAAEEDDDGNHAAGNRVGKAAPQRPPAASAKVTPIRSSTTPPEPDEADVDELYRASQGAATAQDAPDEAPWDYAAFRAAVKASGKRPELAEVAAAGSRLFPTKGLEMVEPKGWKLDDREWRQLAEVVLA